MYVIMLGQVQVVSCGFYPLYLHSFIRLQDRQDNDPVAQGEPLLDNGCLKTRRLVGWSLTSLFITNTATSETKPKTRTIMMYALHPWQ